MTCLRIIAALTLLLPSVAAAAADYPAPKSGDWIAPNFKFHTGEMIAQLKFGGKRADARFCGDIVRP